MRTFDEFHTITPQLTVRGAAQAIAFYEQAFGAHELLHNFAADGSSIMHAELLCGDSRFFVHDEFPEQGALSPLSLGGSPVTFHLYVEQVDEVFERAVAAGAEVVTPVTNMFWGERYGCLKDPFGHYWSISTRLEDLSPTELQERATAQATWYRESDGQFRQTS